MTQGVGTAEVIKQTICLNRNCAFTFSFLPFCFPVIPPTLFLYFYFLPVFPILVYVHTYNCSKSSLFYATCKFLNSWDLGMFSASRYFELVSVFACLFMVPYLL